MTPEQKELLLKDLCCRLPYGVKLQHVKNTDSIVELYSIDLDDFYCKIQFYTYKGKTLTASDEGKLLKPGGCPRYKPYLFPLSSMTEEQKKELNEIIYLEVEVAMSHIKNGIPNLLTGINRLNWLLKNHFDIYDLIPMGLAEDATGKNIYSK